MSTAYKTFTFLIIVLFMCSNIGIVFTDEINSPTAGDLCLVEYEGIVFIAEYSGVPMEKDFYFIRYSGENSVVTTIATKTVSGMTSESDRRSFTHTELSLFDELPSPIKEIFPTLYIGKVFSMTTEGRNVICTVKEIKIWKCMARLMKIIDILTNGYENTEASKGEKYFPAEYFYSENMKIAILPLSSEHELIGTTTYDGKVIYVSTREIESEIVCDSRRYYWEIKSRGTFSVAL